jgi:hypothetical protein
MSTMAKTGRQRKGMEVLKSQLKRPAARIERAGAPETVMNTISGSVVSKETNLGIRDVLVVIYEVDSNAKPDEIIRVSAPSSRKASRLGSVRTDANGNFLLTYEDKDFRRRNADEKRPNILLTVIPPEEKADGNVRPLFISPIRKIAGRAEEYLIELPDQKLQEAGIPLPIDPSVAKEEPQALIRKLRQAVHFRVALADETRNIAAARVDAARNLAKATDAVVEARMMEFLTGMTAEESKRLNFVPPGANPEGVVWDTAKRNIESHVNSNPVAGYLVLTEREAAQFLDSHGNPRQHIPAEEIEPFLYDAKSNSKRTGSIVRSDPIAALRREQTAPDPILSTLNGDGSGTPTNGGSTTNSDQPVTFPQDLPKFIGRLVNPIVAPENNEIFGKPGRPTSDDVKDSIKKLAIGGGPADVTAFYDFHQLQIAFDYVWQHAIDEGIIQKAKALTQTIIARGGDPVAALQQGGDPIAALREEVRHVASAQESMGGPGIIARYSKDLITPYDPDKFIDGDGGGTPPHPPQPPPKPPKPPRPPKVLDPPFFGDVATPADESAEPGDLLDDLTDLLSEPYKFQVFATGSTNFGLMVIYRQKWDPITYQVGRLVKTLTLAPKETRKVTSKRTVKRERAVKELQENQRIRKDEISETMRDEAEIVQRAQNKTSFSLNTKGSFDIGIYDGDATTTISRDAEASSQETKKAFHEAVLKAAQEFKDERKLEVETKESIEEETTDSAEIANPNDELTCTYLFYELQRLYSVTECIHHLKPVVMVAMEMPKPSRSAIDRTLLAHSWIINRVLLDDRYRAPLDYLCTRVVGDQLALAELANNVAQVRASVEQLKKLHRDMQAEIDAQRRAMQEAINTRADKIAKEQGEGFLEKSWEAIAGSGKEEDLESARILEDAAKDRYEKAVREEKELRMRLDAETAALSTAIEAYAKARAEHANRLLQIAGLRVHFKENALFYMQAIWSYTFRDQIFFQLCNVKVPKLKEPQKNYNLAIPDEIPLSIAPKPGQVVLEVHAEIKFDANLDPNKDFVTLAEIAHLGNPIAMRGNYLVFALKESNPLTDYMMLPYLDSELGIHDPDQLGSWTPEDFVKYARCLQEKLKDKLSPSAYAALQNELREQYKRIVSNPRPTNDVVVVPTTSLYIEALPGTHPLLENFKLEHRAIDVQKVQAEVRRMEMENLRYAARLLGDELADPEIEKKIVVRGSGVSPHIDVDT